MVKLFTKKVSYENKQERLSIYIDFSFDKANNMNQNTISSLLSLKARKNLHTTDHT